MDGAVLFIVQTVGRKYAIEHNQAGDQEDEENVLVKVMNLGLSVISGGIENVQL